MLPSDIIYGKIDADSGEVLPDPLRFEYPDPTPVVLPVDDSITPNTIEALMAQARLRASMVPQIDETFEESDDFDVEGDIPDYGSTKWEFAADAAQMTPEALFQSVYGMSREDAQAKLRQLVAKEHGLVEPDPIGDNNVA